MLFELFDIPLAASAHKVCDGTRFVSQLSKLIHPGQAPKVDYAAGTFSKLEDLWGRSLRVDILDSVESIPAPILLVDRCEQFQGEIRESSERRASPEARSTPNIQELGAPGVPPNPESCNRESRIYCLFFVRGQITISKCRKNDFTVTRIGMSFGWRNCWRLRPLGPTLTPKKGFYDNESQRRVGGNPFFGYTSSSIDTCCLNNC